MRTHRQIADVSIWLRKSAFLCIPHGTKLRRQVSPALATRVDTIIGNYSRELTQELKHRLDDPEETESGTPRLGVLQSFSSRSPG